MAYRTVASYAALRVVQFQTMFADQTSFLHDRKTFKVNARIIVQSCAKLPAEELVPANRKFTAALMHEGSMP